MKSTKRTITNNAEATRAHRLREEAEDAQDIAAAAAAVANSNPANRRTLDDLRRVVSERQLVS